MRPFVRGVVVSLGAVLFAAAAVAPLAAEMGKDKFKPGDVAPDFAVDDLQGNRVELSGFRGTSTVLLNFWGLRCGACLEEMPYLDAISKRYAGKGLVVLGVNTDGVGASDVNEVLAELKLSVTYPLLLDPEFAVTDAYTNFLVPLTLVIDRAGVVQYIHTGFEKGTEKDYENAVQKALGS